MMDTKLLCQYLQACAQVSLAEFNETENNSWCKWYNLLSLKFMHNGGSLPSILLKDDGGGSDDSTIISSQTSTLTRNQGIFCIYIILLI